MIGSYSMEAMQKKKRQPTGRIISVIGPGGLVIIHQITGRDIEKVTAAISPKIARRLEEERQGRETG